LAHEFELIASSENEEAMYPWGCSQGRLPPLSMACLHFVALLAGLLPDCRVCASFRGVELFSASPNLGSSAGLGSTFLPLPQFRSSSHVEISKRHNAMQGHSKRAEKRSSIQYLETDASRQREDRTQTQNATIQAKIKNVSDSELLAEISAEELRMQDTLKEIGKSLNLTQKRAQRALDYANWTVLNSTDTKERATKATAAAMKNNDTMKMLTALFPKLNASLVKATKKITDTNASIAKMEKDMGDAAKEKTAMKRATDAEDVLKLLAPRIDKIEEHTDKIEQIEHLGNFTLVVDDEINKDIQKSLDDIESTFAVQIVKPR